MTITIHPFYFCFLAFKVEKIWSTSAIFSTNTNDLRLQLQLEKPAQLSPPLHVASVISTFRLLCARWVLVVKRQR